MQGCDTPYCNNHDCSCHKQCKKDHPDWHYCDGSCNKDEQCKHSWIDLNLKSIAIDPAQCSKCKIIKSKYEFAQPQEHEYWERNKTGGRAIPTQEPQSVPWEKELLEAMQEEVITYRDIKNIFEKAIAQERQALVEKTIKEFLEGKRCLTCGKEKEPNPLTDTCADCFENN